MRRNLTFQQLRFQMEAPNFYCGFEIFFKINLVNLAVSSLGVDLLFGVRLASVILTTNFKLDCVPIIFIKKTRFELLSTCKFC